MLRIAVFLPPLTEALKNLMQNSCIRYCILSILHFVVYFHAKNVACLLVCAIGKLRCSYIDLMRNSPTFFSEYPAMGVHPLLLESKYC